MKQWAIHIFYLTIIAFLSYNYWSSVQAFKAFEHLDQQLILNYEVMNNTTTYIQRDIEKQYKAHPSPINSQYISKCELATNFTNQVLDFIKKNKTDLNSNIVNRSNYMMNSPNNSFFTANRIEEIRNELIKYQSSLIQLFKDDNKVKNDIEQQFNLSKIINDKEYWQMLKRLPLNGVSTQLSVFANQIKVDELIVSNYFKSQIGGTTMEENYYRTAIAPKKAVLIEGETFEADIYLAKFASNPEKNLVIKVNGEPLEIIDGVAHFKSKNQTVGTKTIKAEAIIRNPLTGQTTTTEGSFEYQVLPKCSRDCQ